MQNDQALYQQAIQHYQSQDLVNAERLLRQILSMNPKHAPSLHVMGIIALDVQKFDVAEELVRSAIAQQGNIPTYHFTLGRILVRLQKKEDAEESYKKAIDLKPDYIDALNNLSTILLSSGREKEAANILNRILDKHPANLNALCNIASILYEEGKFDLSLDYYRKAQSVDPSNDRISYDIGRILCVTGDINAGLESFKKGYALNPDNIEIVLSIADIYRDKGQLDEALGYYKKAKVGNYYEYASGNIVSIYFKKADYDLALAEAEQAVKDQPESAQNLSNLGAANYKIKRYQEALKFYQKAVGIDPNYSEAYANMGGTLKDLGETAESIEVYKKSLEISPRPHVYSNLLLTMIYAQSVSPEDLADMARKFGRDVADPLQRARPFSNDRNIQRRLKIGYMSPDFRDHAVSYFLKPVYNHNREYFETFAYSKVETEDAVTNRIKTEFDHWRDLRFHNDDQAADLIESDQIDILVDLAGHTANNGLMIFARKPAPIQVSWLGYTATTGMKAIDYRITDSLAEPPGLTENLNTEELWRLPETFLAYSPRENSPAVVDKAPFQNNGFVTFGCFNNFTKVTDEVLSTWASIMNMVPNSKLLIEISGISDPVTRKNVEARMQKSGLSLDRVWLEPYKRDNQYILYNRIDIALDPFPCVGGTTSMDTLWMGVPFVTLAGRSFSSRMGVSILTNVGLQELIADDVSSYISLAVDLAKNQDRLKAMRQGLRERMICSPLMNYNLFTQRLEQSYQGMWKKWIESNKG